MKHAFVLLGGMALVLAAAVDIPANNELTPMEELGKQLFFDEDLSTPPGQSCATCHAPETGFTGPDSDINATQAVYPGVVHTRFGNRKPPTAAYGGESPVLYYDEEEEVWIGGMFWDGRATGWTLGDPLAEQARGPFLNPLEQNSPNAKHVCKKVHDADYADLFEAVWGPGSLDFKKDVEGTYERIARSIAAYEKSSEVNPFSSKYDYFLAGDVVLTDQEDLGLELFEGKAMCSACHPSELRPEDKPPLFTDFTYDNLGMPKNPENPFYTMPRRWNPEGADWVDPGLGGFLRNAGYGSEVYDPEWGKHKVPTLRNVDMRPDEAFVKAYGHNGYFKSLEEIVHFYNTRDVESWPDPEVPVNVNEDELGDLGLTSDEEEAIVAFLKTLTDGYVLAKPIASAHVAALPYAHRLMQNVPNPFNPVTTIAYDLPEPGDVTLTLYTITGQKAAVLVDGHQSAGHHTVMFDGSAYANGVYLYRLEAGSFVETKGMVLLK